MCGIAGVIRFGHRPDLPGDTDAPADAHSMALARAMVARLEHRGPDATGTWGEWPIALGHARLSIIDLDGGAQPMSSPDGRYVISFNGEIFNYIELRDELRAEGFEFRTRSDTEVVLQAYARWGEQCVHHFNGQWAFALWDRREQRLVLSRDRLGIRPLYYARADDHVVFASEVKALLADPDIPRELDPRGLHQLLTLWTPLAPRTVFRGIEELPPGCQIVVSTADRHPPGQATPILSPVRYWHWDHGETRDDSGAAWRCIDDCAAELRALLDDATRLRLRSDVPVGAYLSGGLDSSIITALIRGHSPTLGEQRPTPAAADATERLRTFSVTFDDAEFDESAHQREMVDFLGTDHEALHCRPADIADVFPQVVWHAERPMLRAAPAPLMLLANLVRESGFKVVLTGEGADEILAGYDIFKEAKLRRFCAMAPDSPRRTRLFERLYPYLPRLNEQSAAYRCKFFRVRPSELDNPLFSHLPRWEMTGQIARLLAPRLQMELAGHEPMADVEAMLPPRFQDFPPMGRWQWLEASVLMPGYILGSQGDRMAMAHGVEGRFPLLDHRIAEFAARVPPRWRMRGLREKYLLRRAVAGLLPERLRWRTKQPYRAPGARSFFDPDTGRARAQYVEELLDPRRVAEDGVFNPQAVAGLVAKARKGRISGTRDNMALVAVLSTQLLVRDFLRQPPAHSRRAAADTSITSTRPGIVLPTGTSDHHPLPSPSVPS